MVRSMVGRQQINFLIVTWAEYLLVTWPVAPLSTHRVDIVGTTGRQGDQAFYLPRICIIEGHKVMHQFLYMPICPVPLLGHDLLSKLRATIAFADNGQLDLQVPKPRLVITLTISREETN